MQPFCPETVLPHLSNNRTGQIVSACLLSRHQLNPYHTYNWKLSISPLR